jgi:hypothetical protein
MGTTVSSMFHAHGSAAGVAAGGGGGATWLGLALVAAAALVFVVLRRTSGRRAPGAGTAGRRAASGGGAGGAVVRALGALGGSVGTGGDGLRVLSRLTLGPGRYLCLVEAGDKALLVAVGGDIRLMGEVAVRLPRSRRRRESVARQLLAERVAALGAGDGAFGSEDDDGASSAVASADASAGAILGPVPVSAAAVGAATASPAVPAPAPASPAIFTAIARDRYAATAQTAPAAGRAPDPEAADAAFFSRLLEASIERMEALDARLVGQRGLMTAGEDAGA